MMTKTSSLFLEEAPNDERRVYFFLEFSSENLEFLVKEVVRSENNYGETHHTLRDFASTATEAQKSALRSHVRLSLT
jgi:hypothetical protein